MTKRKKRDALLQPLSFERRGATRSEGVRSVPRKSLGQHFLRDEGILKKIADFAQIKNTDVVVEVGPGEGSLTKLLLERANKVIVVEKDVGLAEALRERFRNGTRERLEVLTGDILKIEKLIENWKLKIGNYILVGNIPYYITGAIFKKFLQSENPPKSITFVVQKEVADRIIAKDGKESILSISIKAYGTPEYGSIIRAGSFYPRPKVDSAIISIRNVSKEKFQRSDLGKCPKDQIFGIKEEKFFEILKKGFAHRRKLLIRNLDRFGKNEKLKEIFKKCGIPEKIRAENLKVEDWIRLTKELS